MDTLSPLLDSPKLAVDLRHPVVDGIGQGLHTRLERCELHPGRRRSALVDPSDEVLTCCDIDVFPTLDAVLRRPKLGKEVFVEHSVLRLVPEGLDPAVQQVPRDPQGAVNPVRVLLQPSPANLADDPGVEAGEVR